MESYEKFFKKPINTRTLLTLIQLFTSLFSYQQKKSLKNNTFLNVFLLNLLIYCLINVNKKYLI